jgi:hypothetical protein
MQFLKSVGKSEQCNAKNVIRTTFLNTLHPPPTAPEVRQLKGQYHEGLGAAGISIIILKQPTELWENM